MQIDADRILSADAGLCLNNGTADFSRQQEAALQQAVSDAINKLGRSAQLAQDLQVRMCHTRMLPDAADTLFAADAAPGLNYLSGSTVLRYTTNTNDKSRFPHEVSWPSVYQASVKSSSHRCTNAGVDVCHAGGSGGRKGGWKPRHVAAGPKSTAGVCDALVGAWC